MECPVLKSSSYLRYLRNLRLIGALVQFRRNMSEFYDYRRHCLTSMLLLSG